MGNTIGLDIGVASVGSAIIGDDGNLIECTSNIFPEADAAKNIDRRSMRQTRRLTRRRRTRVNDFAKLWKKYGFDIPEEITNNPLQLRVRGLNEKLSLTEIYIVLQNNLLHRGISYLEDAADDVSGGSSYAKGLSRNQEQLKDKYPCQIQLERLENYGFYRGQKVIKENGEEIILSNVFTISSYRKEIEQFLNTQKDFYNSISDNFIKDYFEIFNRKRAYYDGPGNELSRTDYGKYSTKIDENGNYITEENIFDKLVGMCSVYPEERRASGASYTAQEFNVLNDLNNLLVNGRKLTTDEKKSIINLMQTEKVVSVPKFIKKVLNEDIESIEGARTDKDDKQIFHSFEVFNKMRKAFDAINISIKEQFSIEELDLIGDILTLNTDKESILSAFERRNLKYEDEIIDTFISVRKKNGSSFSKWHSFSIKIMKELVPAMYETDKNQMQLLTDMGVFTSSSEKYKGLKYVPEKDILDEIYNPVVRRSVHTSIKVINAYIRKYGYPERIVIEMPRDKNSDEEKKFIEKVQKKNEKELENILNICANEYGYEIRDEAFRYHKKLALKLKLWNEQGRKCLYSGRPIDIRDLVEKPDNFEVDHIIPISISFDDSRNNKALVYFIENQNKGNNTPYNYLRNVNREWNYEQYKAYVLSLGLNKNKVKNLLEERDITKHEVLSGFINRNINDTAYASRVVLNTLQSFFNANETNTKVSVIRGSFTHQMRVNLNLKKNREESYAHHAVDAMLIAYSKMGYDAYHRLQGNIIDFETGEILGDHKALELINDDEYQKALYGAYKIRENVEKANKEVKYNYYVDKKVNRGLCNQTIRGSRECDGKTYKINKLNIYDDFKIFKDKIEKGKEDLFLMKKNDPRTFEDLMKIYNDYKDAANPFVEYEKETGDYPRKYSKKHNGPKITYLKYLDGEVGACIDISHKYGHEKGSKKVFLESLNPYRMDVYFNTHDNLYYFVGLKYSDFKYDNNIYTINEAAYNVALRSEKLIDDTQTINDLQSLGFEYRLSFYKNDIIQYEKNGELIEERFCSRTIPKQKNYIESKPLDKAKFNKRNRIGLSKTTKVIKINTDILGNKYYIEKEKFPK